MEKFSKGVSCLCWAYNEELLIEGFLRRLNGLLRQTIEDYEIVVVDDCSTDRTKAILQNLQKEIPQINLIENPVNLNVGLSFQRAVQAAKKEYLFWQTIDWSYDLKNLRAYLGLLEEYDIVAGFRTKNFATRSDTFSKAIVSLCNYLLIRILFGVPLSDFQNVCIYPTALIRSFRYESNSSFSNPEGLIKAYWKGTRIAEVPIDFIPRKKGEAKGTKIKAILASVRNVFYLWWRWRVLGKFDFQKRGEVVRIDPSSLQRGDWKRRIKTDLFFSGHRQEKGF